jgi:catechol 2,3-dioxygenase-like lactoylglutathione lyase family enzyme
MAEKQAFQYAVGMFAHIQIGVRDLKAMTAFYDAVLSELGLLRDTDLGHVGPAGVIWRLHGSRWPQFVINLPFDGKPSTTANGSQVSFLCASRSAVDAAWSAAISQSALDLGAPGVRTRYAADFYAAYCSDPEGNKLCFVYTDPKP